MAKLAKNQSIWPSTFSGLAAALIENSISQIKLILYVIFIFYSIWGVTCSLLRKLKDSNACLAYIDLNIVFKNLTWLISKLKDQDLTLLEWYVCLTYCRITTENNENQWRRVLFTNGKNVDKVPLTKKPLIDLAKRAAYQPGYVVIVNSEILFNKSLYCIEISRLIWNAIWLTGFTWFYILAFTETYF